MITKAVPPAMVLVPVRATVAVPLVWKARRLGALVATTPGRRPFTEEELILLRSVANQAATALENGQLEQSLAELSRLTGLEVLEEPAIDAMLHLTKGEDT